MFTSNRTLDELLRETMEHMPPASHVGRIEQGEEGCRLPEAIQACVQQMARDVLCDATGLQVTLCGGLQEELAHPESIVSEPAPPDVQSALLEREGAESMDFLLLVNAGRAGDPPPAPYHRPYQHSLVRAVCALFRGLRDKADKSPAEESYVALVRAIVQEELDAGGNHLDIAALEEATGPDDAALGRLLSLFQSRLRNLFWEHFCDIQHRDQRVVDFFCRVAALEKAARGQGRNFAQTGGLANLNRRLKEIVADLQGESKSTSKGRIDLTLLKGDPPLGRRHDLAATMDFLNTHLPDHLDELNALLDQIEEKSRKLEEQERSQGSPPEDARRSPKTRPWHRTFSRVLGNLWDDLRYAPWHIRWAWILTLGIASSPVAIKAFRLEDEWADLRNKVATTSLFCSRN